MAVAAAAAAAGGGSTAAAGAGSGGAAAGAGAGGGAAATGAPAGATAAAPGAQNLNGVFNTKLTGSPLNEIMRQVAEDSDVFAGKSTIQHHLGKELPPEINPENLPGQEYWPDNENFLFRQPHDGAERFGLPQDHPSVDPDLREWDRDPFEPSPSDRSRQPQPEGEAEGTEPPPENSSDPSRTPDQRRADDVPETLVPSEDAELDKPEPLPSDRSQYEKTEPDVSEETAEPMMPPRFKFNPSARSDRELDVLIWTVTNVYGGWDKVNLNQPVMGADGRTVSQGDWIIDNFWRKMGRDLSTAGHMSRSLLASTLVSGGQAMGLDENQLNALGQFGESVEAMVPGKPTAAGARQRLGKMWRGIKNKGGLTYPRARATTGGPKREQGTPVKPLSKQMIKDLDLSKKEQEIIMDGALLFRDSTTLVESAMPNAPKFQTSKEAHRMSQDILEALYPETTREPATGFSRSSRSTLGDVAAHSYEANIILEFARSVKVTDGFLAKTQRDFGRHDESAQVQSLRLAPEQHLGRRALVIDSQGSVFYFHPPSQSWKQGN